MKKKENLTETEIAKRFFQAIQELTKRKVIRGLQTYTSAHGINYGNMNTLKNHVEKYTLKTYHLAYLAEDYGVSCEWLVKGTGEMFVEGSPALEPEHVFFAEEYAATHMSRSKKTVTGVKVESGK